MTPEQRRERQRQHYTNVVATEPTRLTKQKHGKLVGGRNLYPHKSRCTCDSQMSYVDPEGDVICGKCGLVKV